jgi:hypothetical protein
MLRATNGETAGHEISGLKFSAAPAGKGFVDASAHR